MESFLWVLKLSSQASQASSSLVEHHLLPNSHDVCSNIQVWGLYHWANLLSFLFFLFLEEQSQVSFVESLQLYQQDDQSGRGYD